MAKIVHICLCWAMTDGLHYQENLLSKYHRKMGYDVTVITSQWIQNEKGGIKRAGNNIYKNKDDVKIVRLACVFGNINSKFKVYPALYKTVALEKPEILFIHGCQFLDLSVLLKYAKKKNTQIYIDNHVDFYNGAKNWISRKVLHGIVWKCQVKKAEKYVTKFYGVTPARVEFLKEVYDVPPDKCSFLLMGADDELVAAAGSMEQRRMLRRSFGIRDEDFLLVTGGKINRFRPETLNLMRAVSALQRKDIKLLVFGTADEERKAEFDRLCLDASIVYAGWIAPKETYRCMAAADLAVFPGLHSVMWEQAVALGIPCIFKDIEGFHHVDTGGNAVFLKDTSQKSLMDIIQSIADDSARYADMKKNALSDKRKRYLYSRIAIESMGKSV